MPLYYRDQIIGVLELLDKQGVPHFLEEDIEILGIFANQAAIAIEQSRSHHYLISLLGEILQPIAKEGSDILPTFFQRVHEFAEHIEDQDVHYRHALELAVLIQEICAIGDNERILCFNILQHISSYIRNHHDARLWERI